MASGADLERAERRRGVRREERVPRARGEDHHTPLFEMADGTAPDVRLGDFGHRDRGEHSRVDACPLERVLQGQRVQERREHARVIRRRPVHAVRRGGHAAVDISSSDDDGELSPGRVHGGDLRADRANRLRVDPVLALAEERLARQLEQ